VLIRIGHSPDPDDAFMFHAWTAGKVRCPGIEIDHVLDDIESLNRRALTGELEVTAVSAASYPQVASRYRLMDAGASMGRGYGPILVARQPLDPGSLDGRVVAIPGPLTTAALLLQIYCGELSTISMRFDHIPQAVLDGRADLGLLIHEGQITHAALGLHKVLDLGECWQHETSLPLPLGVNVVRRDLGDRIHRALSGALRDSIAHAHANPDAALDHALTFGRGIDRETCRRFVLMYVNEYTVTLGDAGRRALEHLYARAQQVGAIGASPPIDPV
jgi:1,4-dihydroxy-6-naphthoate synthase